ncbi:hypothetical protein Tco_0032614 [Tanacetum coccineum]
MDEGFIATGYPKVQENLKLKVKEQSIPEEPVSSTGTLSSPQHLAKDFSFDYQFFNDKPSEAENEKTTTETEAKSMVSVTIHQDMSAIPLMTSLVIDVISRSDSPNEHRPLPTTTTTTTTTIITTLPLPPQPQQGSSDSILIQRIGELEQHMADMVQANLAMEERIDKHGSRLYKLDNLDISHQVSKAVDEIVTDVVDWAIQAPLRDCFRDLPEANMKEILHHRMWESNSYKAHEDHKKFMKKKKKRHDLPKTPPGSPPHQPPPPPPPAGPSGTSGTFGASGSSQLPPPPPTLSTNQSDQYISTAALSSSKTAASAEYTAWTTTDTRLNPSVLSIPKDLHMDDDTAPNEQPLTEARTATPEPAWSIPSSDLPVPVNNWASALPSTYAPPPENSLLAQTGPAYEIVKVFHPNVIHLQYQMEECHKLLTDQVDESIIRYNVSKPLPLCCPPSQVTIQSDFFFNKDLEYLRYGHKSGRPALSILKMKAAYYPDVGLEQMVPDQMWIKEECKYDITAIAVRTHMRILSVVRIEVFSLYGYDYMKKIVLHRADLNFKYLYPSDFEDLYLLNLQGHLNHLPPKDKKILTTAVNLWTRNLVIRQRVEDFQLGIESYQTQLNLTKPRWDATGFEFKYDFTIIDSPRATEMELVLEHTQQGSSNEVSWVSNSLVHSLHALSTLRRSGLRTTSTAAKPCQGDSSEFYLITGRIPTVTDAGKRRIDS